MIFIVGLTAGLLICFVLLFESRLRKQTLWFFLVFVQGSFSVCLVFFQCLSSNYSSEFLCAFGDFSVSLVFSVFL